MYFVATVSSTHLLTKVGTLDVHLCKATAVLAAQALPWENWEKHSKAVSCCNIPAHRNASILLVTSFWLQTPRRQQELCTSITRQSSCYKKPHISVPEAQRFSWKTWMIDLILIDSLVSSVFLHLLQFRDAAAPGCAWKKCFLAPQLSPQEASREQASREMPKVCKTKTTKTTKTTRPLPGLLRSSSALPNAVPEFWHSATSTTSATLTWLHKSGCPKPGTGYTMPCLVHVSSVSCQAAAFADLQKIALLRLVHYPCPGRVVFPMALYAEGLSLFVRYHKYIQKHTNLWYFVCVCICMYLYVFVVVVVVVVVGICQKSSKESSNLARLRKEGCNGTFIGTVSSKFTLLPWNLDLREFCPQCAHIALL